MAEDGLNHLPAEEQFSLPARFFWLGLAGVLALTVAKWWQFGREIDQVITLVAFAATFLFWIRGTVARRGLSPSVGTGFLGLGLLAGFTWLTALLAPGDFWLLRCVLVVDVLGVSLLLWGWLGPIYGARGLLAAGYWAVLPPGFAGIGNIGDTVGGWTASCAGFVLWQTGHEGQVTGIAIRMADGVVEVRSGCTALELFETCMCLLVPAVLFFRVSWLLGLGIAVVMVFVTFIISVFRVALLATVVGDQARFHYWHNAEGASWFTAVGVVLMAYLIARAVPIRPAEPPGPKTMAPGPVWALGLVGGLAAVAAVVTVCRPLGRAVPMPAVPATLAGWRLKESVDEPEPGWALPDSKRPFSAVRRASYVDAEGQVRLKMDLGYSPCLLETNPLRAAWNYEWFALRGDESQWRRREVAGGTVLEREGAGRIDWIAVLPPGGKPIGEAGVWQRRSGAATGTPGHWWRWATGQESLRDRRAYWLALSWIGSTPMGRQALGDQLQSWSSGSDSLLP